MTDNVPPHTVALARRRASEGAHATAIRKETGLRAEALRRCLAGEFDDGSGAVLPPIAIYKRMKPKKVDRVALVARLWSSAEKQVEEIERRLTQLDQPPAELEGNSRALGALVKTLRDLAAYDETERAKLPAKKKRSSKHDDDDPVPRDIDEFRRALARRMEDFVASRTADGVPGKPAAGLG